MGGGGGGFHVSVVGQNFITLSVVGCQLKFSTFVG